jgi:uncharacterized surface protein with fasciclin (FAS1) repeats
MELGKSQNAKVIVIGTAAGIAATDLSASNGIVHAINHVLLP